MLASWRSFLFFFSFLLFFRVLFGLVFSHFLAEESMRKNFSLTCNLYVNKCTCVCQYTYMYVCVHTQDAINCMQFSCKLGTHSIICLTVLCSPLFLIVFLSFFFFLCFCPFWFLPIFPRNFNNQRRAVMNR